MSANQRIKILISYLKDNKKIRNQQDFVERIGSDKSTVSQIINEKIAVPNSLFEKINDAFPDISKNWLLTGEGEIIHHSVIQHNQNGNNINGQNIAIDKPDLDKFMDALNKCYDIIKQKDEQISKLIDMLNK